MRAATGVGAFAHAQGGTKDLTLSGGGCDVIAAILALSLVVATFLLHFFVLRWLSGSMARIPMTAGVRIMVIVLVALAAHLGEISLYAGAYALGDRVLTVGSLGGVRIAEPLDYFYFSIVSYTSLGIGDAFPNDHLRFITGVEALNGLLLITWSATSPWDAYGHGSLALSPVVKGICKQQKDESHACERHHDARRCHSRSGNGFGVHCKDPD